MRIFVKDQMRAEDSLCRAIYRLMVTFDYSVYQVRDAFDLLSGQFYHNRQTWMAAPEPTAVELADIAFRGAPLHHLDLRREFSL